MPHGTGAPPPHTALCPGALPGYCMYLDATSRHDVGSQSPIPDCFDAIFTVCSFKLWEKEILRQEQCFQHQTEKKHRMTRYSRGVVNIHRISTRAFFQLFNESGGVSCQLAQPFLPFLWTPLSCGRSYIFIHEAGGKGNLIKELSIVTPLGSA